ncbi:MAG TPA: glutathione synthase [Kofleriaceae bacterium]|nr:glutathione synthase [Kofleriaceae bacterium]
MRVLFVLDPLAALHLAGDTTYALMLEASRRGHEVWTCQAGHLGLEHDDPIAEAELTAVSAATTAAEAFRTEARMPIPLDAFGAVLMRTDPPFDVDYLQATWLLDRARGKTLLINDPRGLRDLNEHLAVLAFPELTPPTIVTRSARRLREFLEEQGGAIVVKPVDGYAGLGVFLIRAGDPNTSSLIETATRVGRAWTVAQRYLPQAQEGDKRILLVDGAPIGAFLRVPPPGEARDNLHVGGTARACDLTAEDHAIVRAVAPFLAQHGQIFVGLDVIGGRLTELNITSPTGIRHLDVLAGEARHAAPLFEWVERRARPAPPRP